MSTTRAGRPPVALVTGASSGIGRATAERLAARGWRVYGTSRRAPRAVVETPAPDAAPVLRMIPLDVTSDQSVEAAVGLVLAREGRIDAVVNNAGFGLAGAVELTTIEQAREQFETNFFGTVRVCRAVLPVMRQQRGGRIVNISSIAGVIAVPFQAFYSASKFAVEGYSEALRLEVAPYGIAVVLIEPGDFRTGFTAARRRAGSAPPPGPAPTAGSAANAGRAPTAGPAPQSGAAPNPDAGGQATPLAGPAASHAGRADPDVGRADPDVGRAFRPGEPDAGASRPLYAAESRALAVMERDETRGATPEAVARLVHRVLTMRSPGVRYSVGPAAERAALLLKRLLPSRLMAWGMGRYYGASELTVEESGAAQRNRN